MAEVSFEFLKLGAIGQVPLDMVPDEETENFRFWRAASLAKIAFNIQDGRPALNAGADDDPTIYFFDNRSSLLGARNQALFWADRYTNQRQLTGRDISRLLEVHRMPFKLKWLPRVVLALDKRHNDLELPPNATDPTRNGVNLHKFFDLDDIDPNSKQLIEEILSL